MTHDVTQDTDGKEDDNGEWDEVSKCEESGIKLSGSQVTGDYADRHLALLVQHSSVLDQNWGVDSQHQDPDGDDHGYDAADGTISCRAVCVNNRHVAYDGDEYERVDGDVSCDVDEIVHQSTRDVAKRPLVGGKHVRRGRRDDHNKRQVGNGKIQQQQIGHSTHALFGHNDVDDETISDHTEDRDDAVQNWNSDFIKKESKIVVFGGRVVGSCRRHCWGHCQF